MTEEGFGNTFVYDRLEGENYDLYYARIRNAQQGIFADVDTNTGNKEPAFTSHLSEVLPNQLIENTQYLLYNATSRHKKTMTFVKKEEEDDDEYKFIFKDSVGTVSLFGNTKANIFYNDFQVFESNKKKNTEKTLASGVNPDAAKIISKFVGGKKRATRKHKSKQSKKRKPKKTRKHKK